MEPENKHQQSEALVEGKLPQNGSDAGFRPRISTYAGQELTPYRMRTTSQSESSRHPRARRLTGLTASHTKIGAFSSTESLFSSLIFLPPHGDSKGVYKRRTPVQNGTTRNDETGEADEILISSGHAKSVASSSSTDSLQMEPFEAWKVLVTCTLTFVLIGINWVAFPMFYVEFTEQFQTSKSVLGWIGSLQNAGSQIIGLFVSAPVQVYGCRPVAIAGGVVLGIGTALSALSPNVGYLYFSYGVISGFGLGMVNLSATVIVQQHFNRNRTIATAIAMMGGSLGQVIGPPILEFLIYFYGWRGAMLIFGAIMLHSIPFAISFSPSNSTAAAKKKDKSMREMMRRMFDFSLLREVSFTLFCCSFFLVKFNVFGFYQHLPSRVVHKGMTKRVATLLMMVTAILAAISRLCGGFIGNLKCANRALMYAVAVTVAGVDTILLACATTLPMIVAICGVFGACMGTTMLMVSVVLVDLLGVEKIARSHGLFNVYSGVAGLLATPFSGWIFDMTQNYDIPFIVVGVMGTVGGLVAFVVVILEKLNERRQLQTT